MTETSSDFVVSLESSACKKPEDIQDFLHPKEGIEGWDNFSHIVQAAVNVLSPKDTQYQLPQGLIELIRERLLDDTQDTLEFRTNAAALIEPVAFVNEDTSTQVDSVVIAEGFGVEADRSEGLDITTFLKKYAAVLGYEPTEIKKEELVTGNIAESVSEEQKLMIQAIRYLENPEKGETELSDAIAYHYKITNPEPGATLKSPKAIQRAQERVDFLQAVKAQAISEEINTREPAKALLDFLKKTSDEVFDAVLALAIKNLEAGKELVNNQAALQQLLDAGLDQPLAYAIDQTDAGKETAKSPKNLQAMLDKRMDRSLAAAIRGYDFTTETHSNNEVLVFMNDEKTIQAMITGGMKDALYSLIHSTATEAGRTVINKEIVDETGEGAAAEKTFSKAFPNCEEECEQQFNKKKKLIKFKKTGASQIFST